MPDKSSLGKVERPWKEGEGSLFAFRGSSMESFLRRSRYSIGKGGGRLRPLRKT